MIPVATTWAVVPVGRLNRTKSRLAAVLSPAERVDLTKQMLRTVLCALNRAEQVQRTAVISPDPAVQQLAVNQAAIALVEEEQGGLNAALTQAWHHLAARDVKRMAVFPSDLPLLTAAAVDRFLTAAPSEHVLLCGDDDDNGTNGLCVPIRHRNARPFPFQYGPHSYTAHRRAAGAHGFPVTAVLNAQLQFDLDTVADWQQYRRARAPQRGTCS